MSLQALHRGAPTLRSVARVPVRLAAAPSADDSLRRAVLRRLESAPWWDSRTANVFVDRGVVVYQGWRGRRDDRAAARRLALATPGVQGVWDARVPRREWQGLA